MLHGYCLPPLYSASAWMGYYLLLYIQGTEHPSQGFFLLSTFSMS